MDTSVIGGYYDPGFVTATRRLFERIACRKFDVYISELGRAELAGAPQQVREVVKLIPASCLHHAEMTDDIKALALLYVKALTLFNAGGDAPAPALTRNSAYHVAMASAYRAGCVVSWDYGRLVSYGRVKIFNVINLRMGYPLVDVRSPLEFVADASAGREKDFDTVARFGAAKEAITKATRGMRLQEERSLWKQVENGELKMTNEESPALNS
jgi:hypothetical protein